MLLWCLISPCPSKIVCSNNTTGTFYSCRMVSCCLLCYSIYSNPLCPMQYCLHRLMEQLSIPGKELLWCLICLCPSKVVCSNNIIGTFYSCRMVSSCSSHTFLCFMCYFIYCNVLCIIGHEDRWSNWVDLARSSFGVLSVHFLPKSSVVTVQLELYTLV